MPARKPSAGRAPLLILLHGFGSNEHDLFGLHPYLDERFQVISARAPLTLQQGSYAWYHIQWQNDGSVVMDDAQAEAAIEALNEFVRAAAAAYDAEPARVFLAGFSQGAIMSEWLALTQPSLISGAVLMSGRTLDLVRARDLKPGPDFPPMCVTHGTADAVLPVQEGRATREFLNSLGVDFSYHEYPMAHEINPQCLDDVDTWLSGKLG